MRAERGPAPFPKGGLRAFLSDPEPSPRQRVTNNVVGAALDGVFAFGALLDGRWGLVAFFGAGAVLHVVGVVVWRRRARAAIEDVSEIFR